MKQRAAILLIYCALSLLGGGEAAVAQTNAGFVQGLWYDRETLIVGEPVRIYAAIRNNTGGDLSGTVEFYVNGGRLERNTVAALNNRIIESWADWSPGYGTSTIKATLTRTELSSAASGTRRVEVVSALTEDIVFVDRDTDGDGLGDAIDTDDDGDGLSDRDETEGGTDPLDPDDPGDADEKTAESSVDGEAKETAAANVAQENGAGEPAGLERFLAESRARRTLSAVTDIITNAREGLDDYRDSRNAGSNDTTDDGGGPPEEESSATSTDTTLGTSSASSTGNFGEVQRSQLQEPPASFWAKAWGGIVYILDQLYTFFLFLLSLFLRNPIIVQVSLLVLILYFIYLVARKLGKRPD